MRCRSLYRRLPPISRWLTSITINKTKAMTKPCCNINPYPVPVSMPCDYPKVRYRLVWGGSRSFPFPMGKEYFDQYFKPLLRISYRRWRKKYAIYFFRRHLATLSQQSRRTRVHPRQTKAGLWRNKISGFPCTIQQGPGQDSVHCSVIFVEESGSVVGQVRPPKHFK